MASVIIQRPYIDKIVIYVILGPDVDQANTKWSRPPLPDIDSEKDSITFQQVDISQYALPTGPHGSEPIILIYGVTSQGNSIAAHIHNFLPYFYAQVRI